MNSSSSIAAPLVLVSLEGLAHFLRRKLIDFVTRAAPCAVDLRPSDSDERQHVSKHRPQILAVLAALSRHHTFPLFWSDMADTSSARRSLIAWKTSLGEA